MPLRDRAARPLRSLDGLDSTCRRPDSAATNPPRRNHALLSHAGSLVPVTASPRLGVVKFSDAFENFWPEVAGVLGVTFEEYSARDAASLDPNTGLIVLAAGGAERDAIQWLHTRGVPARVQCYLVGSDPCRRLAMQSIRAGAADYFALPDDVEILRNALAEALRRTVAVAPQSTSDSEAFAAIVGEDPALRDQVGRATRLARHRNATALILGETGTGKELFARAIHMASPRARGPFVPVNCSALPENLVESELFGHERGAFTGAHAAKPGLFEVADGGTIFLDEMGSLPLALQAKLLRVLDDRQIRRVGGTKGREVDVRVLAAANEELGTCVKDGTFREDLFYRLSGVTLRIPPLRERGEDVVRIAQALLVRLALEHGINPPELGRDVRDLLQEHAWPGNVRELKNSVERALLMSPPGELLGEELVPKATPMLDATSPLPFPAPLADISSAAARATVHWCGGNRAESARRLGISPRRLRRLLAGDDAEGERDAPSA